MIAIVEITPKRGTCHGSSRDQRQPDGRVMRMLRAVLASLPLLLLSACWTGDPWFSASDSIAVLPDGRYRLAEQGAAPDAGDRIKIKRQSDGSLLVTGADNPWRAIIVPLDSATGTRFVVQLQELNPRHPTHALFVLLDTKGGRYGIAVLRCTGAAQAAVRGSGGIVISDPQSAASCVFTDRVTLMAQLRAASAADAALDLKLVRDDT